MEPAEVKEHTTLILNGACAGDRVASERLLEVVYQELRALAASHLMRERTGHTLQPTALVHEAYLRLIDQTRVQWQGRAHFMAVAATMMRRILVDHARTRNATKRGGDSARVPLDGLEAAGSLLDVLAGGVDVEALDLALKDLASLDERQVRVVEMRFFAGLDVAGTAEVLGVSERTVKEDWRFARVWLRQRLGRDA